MKRCPGVKITTHKKKVQEINFSFYQQFSIIIGGLDNVEARKYLNNLVFQLNRDQEDVVCYYIDGATEGFSGQALVVEPYLTSCYECSLL
jgi:ubiquitin-activating enzyme E1 C